MQPEPFRLPPKMDPTAYRSFEVHSPLKTHFRAATCAEVECQHHLAGWVSVIDVATEQGRTWATAIKRSGRRYTLDSADTTLTFRFPAGQSCFKSPHRVPLGRPELFVVRDGDWRGNPTGRADRGVRPAEFVERMAENLDTLSTEVNKG
jgi:hypothetical protein